MRLRILIQLHHCRDRAQIRVRPDATEHREHKDQWVPTNKRCALKFAYSVHFELSNTFVWENFYFIGGTFKWKDNQQTQLRRNLTFIIIALQHKVPARALVLERRTAFIPSFPQLSGEHWIRFDLIRLGNFTTSSMCGRVLALHDWCVRGQAENDWCVPLTKTDRVQNVLATTRT